MIKMISDSTSYLPQELIEKYDIDIIPLSVILGPEVIKETQISNEMFYAKMSRSAFHPTSTQPSVESAYSVFEKYIEKGDSIIFTCISEDMSGTYATADTVKKQLLEKYPDAKIELVDARSNSAELGFAVLAGAKAVAGGSSIKQAVEAIKDNVAKSRMLFIPEDLSYLQKSGRLSKASALMASVLQIVPILTVMNGKADLFTKIRTRNGAKKAMLTELARDIDAGTVTDISVMHINNEDEAKKFVESIKALIDIDILFTSIGPVVGSHVGPGTLGVAWCNK